MWPPIINNGDVIYRVYNHDQLVFGGTVDADLLCYDIEIDNSDRIVRLINPLSHPRYSWEGLNQSVQIDWGDGITTQLYARQLNTGRFNRESLFYLAHEYTSALIGDKFTIKIRCKEPLAPIYCKVHTIYGSFPADEYVTMNTMNDFEEMYEVGLFGPTTLHNYPEHRLLNVHRETISWLGPDLLVNWKNVSMKRMFNDFRALNTIEEGFFDSFLHLVSSYEECFMGCFELDRCPVSLLGLINNTVITTRRMFKDCFKLDHILHLTTTPNLVSVYGMYSGCEEALDPNIRFLGDAPNLIDASYLFDGCTNISIIDQRVMINSLKITKMAGAFRRTGITRTYNINHLHYLYDMKFLFSGCNEITDINPSLMTNVGMYASQPLELLGMFSFAGRRGNGLSFSRTMFIDLINRDLHEDQSQILAGCAFKVMPPDDLFRDIFNSSTKEYILDEFFSYTIMEDGSDVEVGSVFTNATGVVSVRRMFSNINDDWDAGGVYLGYISPTIFKDMVNLKTVEGLFDNSNLRMKINENLLRYNTKITNYYKMFFMTNMWFNVPVDNIIYTENTSEVVNLALLFGRSNVISYRPFNVHASRSNIYDVTLMFDDNPASVPMDYIVDGRINIVGANTNPNHIIRPLIIEALVGNDPLLLKVLESTSSIRIEIDGNVSEYSASAGDIISVPLVISSAPSNYLNRCVIYIYSRVAVIPTMPLNANIEAMYGEFPYNSLENHLSSLTVNDMIPLEHIKYLGPVLIGIAAKSNTFRLYRADYGTYIHPWLLKYMHYLTNMDLFDLYSYDLSEPTPTPNYTGARFKMLPPSFIRDNQYNITLNNNVMVNVPSIPDTFINPRASINVNNMMKIHPALPERMSYVVKSEPYSSSSMINNHNTMLNQHVHSVTVRDLANPLSVNTSHAPLTLVCDYPTEGSFRLMPLVGTNYPFTLTYSLINTIGSTSNTVNITSLAHLDTLLSGILLTPTDNIITLFSDVPIWVRNYNAIISVSGVIPGHNMTYKFGTIAPNLNKIEATILHHLTNTNFDNLFKNTKITSIPNSLFVNNMERMTSARECFHGCPITRIEDYLFYASNNDIDLTGIFGNTLLNHIEMVFCSSLQGRLILNRAFENITISALKNPDLFKDVFYSGELGFV